MTNTFNNSDLIYAFIDEDFDNNEIEIVENANGAFKLMCHNSLGLDQELNFKMEIL